jgi:hypothetical protein
MGDSKPARNYRSTLEDKEAEEQEKNRTQTMVESNTVLALAVFYLIV